MHPSRIDLQSIASLLRQTGLSIQDIPHSGFKDVGKSCQEIALGLFGIQLLQAGGLVSGSILLVLGLALLYKGMSRKEAKEHL